MFQEQVRLTEIPAPPFKESTRAQYFLKKVREAGLADARIDAEGNVSPRQEHRRLHLVRWLGRIVNHATGSHRFAVEFKGPGGHSFSAFGLPSAIHAMGRAIAKIGDLTPPAEPKTTFTVGTVKGGTSVNAIAGDATMAIDIRSNSQQELMKFEERVLSAIQQAVQEENQRWKRRALVGRVACADQ